MRVINRRRAGHSRARTHLALGLALILAGAGLAGWFRQPTPAPGPASVVLAAGAATSAPASRAARVPPVELRATPRSRSGPAATQATAVPDELPSGDPNDLATHILPTDPEPTMGEVIETLHELGIRDGLGAFSPPGTSPPLVGLVVPDDFVLPEGYVRHHQVSDAGEPIDPILMFSPDYVFHDAEGRLIALPEDRVVPPELAPPGFPLHQVALPPDR